MTQLITTLAVACSTLVLAAPAAAAEFGVGVKVGTYGWGAEFGVGFTEWFTLRASANTASVSGDYEEDGIDYDAAIIEDAIDEYDFWPIISFGLAIRFR